MEFFCHGAPAVLRAVLARIFALGARPAGRLGHRGERERAPAEERGGDGRHVVGGRRMGLPEGGPVRLGGDRSWHRLRREL